MPDFTRIHVPAGSPVAAAWRGALPPGRAADGEAPVDEPPLPPFPGELQAPRVRVPDCQSREMERTARERAAGPCEDAVRSNRGHVLRMTRRWAERDMTARAAGVQLRKATFFNKLLSFGAALVTLGGTAALSVVTGGAALPLLLLASVRATVLAFDCLCAWVDWRGSREHPPVRMPVGANSLGNMLYGVGSHLGWSEERSKALGRNGGALLTLALSVAGLALASPQEGIDAASAALRYGASVLTLAGTGRQARDSDHYEAIAKARDEARAELQKALLDHAPQAGQDAARLTDLCEELQSELEADGIGADTVGDLRQIFDAVATDFRQHESTTNPVGADRNNTALRLVNDLVGLGAGANMVWTGVAQTRLLEVLDGL